MATADEQHTYIDALAMELKSFVAMPAATATLVEDIPHSHQGHVFAHTHSLAGVQLRHFYTYEWDGWYRYDFEGSVDSFVLAMPSLPCSLMRRLRKPRHTLPPIRPLMSVCERGPSPLLEKCARELRDIVYDECALSDGFVVHSLDRSFFVASAALLGTNRQIRSEFHERLRANEPQLPAVLFYSPEKRRPD